MPHVEKSICQAFIRQAFIRGTERVSAWADLLDRINVFPVADGDTGRNLQISLRPLQHMDGDPEKTAKQFLYVARGNSGNIAALFFSEFIRLKHFADIPLLADAGRKAAYRAVSDPKSGTMLSVFDTLADFPEGAGDTRIKTGMGKEKFPLSLAEKRVRALAGTVADSAELLPELRRADVVDAGALGIFLFLETFFYSLADRPDRMISPVRRFQEKLNIAKTYHRESEKGHCISAVIRARGDRDEIRRSISGCGEHAVIRTVPENDGEQYIAVHLHTQEKNRLREKLASLGNIREWSEEDMQAQIENIPRVHSGIRILTDGAASLNREDANALGITVLNSYILTGDISMPESLFPPAELYRYMREGKKVSTAQASVFERHQHYQSACSQYEKVLYLCVGSVYTGNYGVAGAWRQSSDADNKFHVIDTGTASGCLGLIALSTARYARKADDSASVIPYAEKVISRCEEYLFPDRLQYLAAGGRLSKGSAFFGDMFHMKPVISPLAHGAEKVGMVRNRDAQMDFALDRLKKCLHKNTSFLILLEYSDNRDWVEGTVQTEIRKVSPDSEILLCPLSLTTGAHMGPGTWGAAFLPADFHEV